MRTVNSHQDCNPTPTRRALLTQSTVNTHKMNLFIGARNTHYNIISLDLLKSRPQLRQETKSKVDHFSYVTTSLAVSLIWSSAHMKLQKIHLQAKKIGCTFINIAPGQFLHKCAAMCTAAKSLRVPAKIAKHHRIQQTEDLLVGSRVSH